jgi:uncharacterized membrane protein YfcA
MMVAGGACIVFGSGLLGNSGGSLMTPFICILHPDIPMASILGTLFASMLAPSVVAATVYTRLGLVRPALLPALVGGAIVGAACRSRIALQGPDELLRWGFAVVFSTLGMQILRRPVTSQAVRKIVSTAAKKQQSSLYKI